MGIENLEIGRVGDPIDNNELGYWPVLAAVETGILNTDIAKPLDNPPGVDILNGRLPNHKEAGLIRKGMTPFGAFDLVAARVLGDKIEVLPTFKKVVSKDGLIFGEGLVSFTTTEGEFRIAATVRELGDHTYWSARRFKMQRRLGFLASSDGPDLGVFLASPLEQPRLEVEEVDTSIGAMLIGRPKAVSYSLP